MAEGAFRTAAEKAGLDAVADSAGTADYHIGHNPDPRAIDTARRNGVQISAAIGRQLSADDFTNFTHIIALDKANLAGIKARAPRHSTAQICLLLDEVSGREGEAVADPYYGDEAEFDACWETITEAVDALVERLVKESADV